MFTKTQLTLEGHDQPTGGIIIGQIGLLDDDEAELWNKMEGAMADFTDAMERLNDRSRLYGATKDRLERLKVGMEEKLAQRGQVTIAKKPLLC